MADDTKTWALIHTERAALADQLDSLTPQQWATASLCGTWTVHTAAAHILAGAEQTPGAFFGRLTSAGFRFNTMIDRDAHRLSALPPAEIVSRLRQRTTTTNKAPAPTVAMLGEIVVHSADIRQPLGLPDAPATDAATACLTMYTTASFPVGGKKRIQGLRLHATDVDWTYGEGPEVSGPAVPMLLAMTGRRAGLDGLGGEGLSTLRGRIPA